MSYTETIIIGAGFAGLATANLLADAGRDVLLIEKSNHIGGRAVGHRVGDFYANIGPRAIYMAGPAGRILQQMVIPLDGGTPPLAGSFCVYDEQVHILPSGVMELLKTHVLDVADKAELGMLFGKIRTMSPQAYMNITLHDWLHTAIKRPRVRMFIQMVTRINTYSASTQIMAGAFIRQLQYSLKSGVLYVDGGWHNLAKTMANRAQSKGANIQTGVQVSQVIRHADGFDVQTSTGLLRASQVVLATPPQTAYDLTGDETLYRWKNAVTPIDVACLDIALTHLPNPQRRLVFGMDAPLYFSAHSEFADFGAKSGVLAHVMHYQATDATADRQTLERYLDVIQSGWRDALIEARFMPKMRVTQTLAYPDENITPHIPTMDGLYVVGDWVGRDAILLDACFASAESAVKMISKQIPAEMIR